MESALLSVEKGAQDGDDDLDTYDNTPLTPIHRKQIINYFSLLNIERYDVMVLDNPTVFMSDEEEKLFFKSVRHKLQPHQVCIVLSSKQFSTIHSANPSC